jgi:hypothetical protein
MVCLEVYLALGSATFKPHKRMPFMAENNDKYTEGWFYTRGFNPLLNVPCI